jgi:succinate dehydrogenase / fumarate reductase, cytochrome b subunit
MKTQFLSSSVAKKFGMALTGLLLVGFLVTHLSANLLLYSKDGELFNAYAEKLASFGFLLYVAEAGLVAFFLFHAVTGIRLAFLKRSATPMKYAVNQSKGGPSKWGFAANNMAITGTLLLIFLILHVKHFKYGPGISEGYVTELAGGAEARDLHRYVIEEFKEPKEVLLYSAAMLFLGFHLRHGIWSAFQSLGLTKENNSKAIYIVGGLLGLLLALGFLSIPAYIYFIH